MNTDVTYISEREQKLFDLIKEVFLKWVNPEAENVTVGDPVGGKEWSSVFVYENGKATHYCKIRTYHYGRVLSGHDQPRIGSKFFYRITSK